MEPSLRGDKAECSVGPSPLPSWLLRIRHQQVSPPSPRTTSPSLHCSCRGQKEPCSFEDGLNKCTGGYPGVMEMGLHNKYMSVLVRPSSSLHSKWEPLNPAATRSPQRGRAPHWGLVKTSAAGVLGTEQHRVPLEVLGSEASAMSHGHEPPEQWGWPGTKAYSTQPSLNKYSMNAFTW
jgi:hypothetical protein